MLWHIHCIVYKQVKYYTDVRLYILFMLKPRHAHYKTFRTEEQQQLHTHTSLFHHVHHRDFITMFHPGGFTRGGFTTGGSPQGFTMGGGGGGGGVISVSVGQVSSHAYILTNQYWFWLIL